MRPTGDTVAARGRAVHTVVLDGEAVLLDQSGERLHHLNVTGTLVWSCLDGRSTLAEIAADISRELGAPTTTVMDETVAIMAALQAEGLVDLSG